MQLVIEHTWDGHPLPTPAATLSIQRNWHLTVTAPFHNDPPPSNPPGSCWKLWEHEVVELFVLGEDDQYLEVELGPHGHHLVLRLHGVRNIIEQQLPLDYRVTHSQGRWHGSTALHPDWLPTGTLRVNAYAIHGTGAHRQYAAWAPVPGPQPDFHRLQYFRPLTW